MQRPDIRFCRLCGAATESRIPPNEDRERAVCTRCGYVDYVNPSVIVGAVPVWGDDGRQLLLCRRAIEPRRGLWTLPAGFLEFGEAMVDGAIRETREEAGARIEIGALFTAFDVLVVGQVHAFFLARLLDLELDPGPESLECRVVDVDEIPWDEISFRSVRATLEHYVADLATGSFGLHTGTFG